MEASDVQARPSAKARLWRCLLGKCEGGGGGIGASDVQPRPIRKAAPSALSAASQLSSLAELGGEKLRKP